MRKKIIQFPARKAGDSPPPTKGRSRIMIHVGAQRYAMDITCEATALPPEPAPAATPGGLEELQVQTRFLSASRLYRAIRIDGWRVCWLSGWDKGKVFFVVMVERVVGRGLNVSY